MLEESAKQLRNNLRDLLLKGLMEMYYGRISSVLDYLLNKVLLTNIRATKSYNISVRVD